MKPRSASTSSHSAARTPGEVRIIGGQWRRTRLPVLDRPGLRPTPDRVRETLFNWLGQSLQGWRCADVFAGSGALGLEAASRAAASVVLCEQDRALVAQLRQHVQRLKATQVSIHAGDGLTWLQQQRGQGLDLVFLDPPFDGALFEPALQAAAQAIQPQGWIYLEAPRSWPAQELAAWGLAAHRFVQAGAVHAHLLRPIA